MAHHPRPISSLVTVRSLAANNSRCSGHNRDLRQPERAHAGLSAIQTNERNGTKLGMNSRRKKLCEHDERRRFTEIGVRVGIMVTHNPLYGSGQAGLAAPHDSGSIWVANPLPYDFFIHYTSPVLTA